MSVANGSSLRPALVRAARYRLLAHALTPPRPGWRAALDGLAAEADLPEAALRELPRCSDEDAAREHFLLFTPAGPVSLLASDHVDSGFVDKGPILGDIAGFYRAFGYRQDLQEPPDHLAVVLGFLTLLALKDAAATHEGDAEQVDVARHAERAFLETHVLGRLGAFAERVERVAPDDGIHRPLAALGRRLLDGVG